MNRKELQPSVTLKLWNAIEISVHKYYNAPMAFAFF